MSYDREEDLTVRIGHIRDIIWKNRHELSPILREELVQEIRSIDNEVRANIDTILLPKTMISKINGIKLDLNIV